jgi:DHA2 family multidrug resistance protein-like MFS transporter
MQLVRGYSPLRAGLCVIPVALGQLLGAPRSAKMVNRFGARRVISFGLILVTIGLLAISRYTPSTPLWVVLFFFFIWGLGMGNVVAPATTRMTLAVPPARSGAGSAVQNTVRQVAASLGVAVISSVVAVVYSDKVLPQVSSLPAGARKAASDSIGGAYGVARLLPADAARSLQDVANSAFMHALHAAALMAAALMLIALVIILLWLPAKAEAVAWGNRPAGDASPDGLGSASDVGPHGAGGAADSVEAVDETHLDGSVVDGAVEDSRLIDAAEPGDGDRGR